ncbi:hypothetical protein HDV00_010986 [Rhizophlyctis rosea]|nr:hypothetical protein HDV00_010986 [Rhizophlyctis rosea]
MVTAREETTRHDGTFIDGCELLEGKYPRPETFKKHLNDLKSNILTCEAFEPIVETLYNVREDDGLDLMDLEETGESAEVESTTMDTSAEVEQMAESTTTSTTDITANKTEQTETTANKTDQTDSTITAGRAALLDLMDAEDAEDDDASWNGDEDEDEDDDGSSSGDEDDDASWSGDGDVRVEPKEKAKVVEKPKDPSDPNKWTFDQIEGYLVTPPAVEGTANQLMECLQEGKGKKAANLDFGSIKILTSPCSDFSGQLFIRPAYNFDLYAYGGKKDEQSLHAAAILLESQEESTKFARILILGFNTPNSFKKRYNQDLSRKVRSFLVIDLCLVFLLLSIDITTVCKAGRAEVDLLKLWLNDAKNTDLAIKKYTASVEKFVKCWLTGHRTEGDAILKMWSEGRYE